MTIEELCDCSADKLKAMSNEELMEHFKQYLTVTRPELAARPKQSTARKLSDSRDPRKALAASLLKGFGVDLDDL
jgi:hypothetical protein